MPEVSHHNTSEDLETILELIEPGLLSNEGYYHYCEPQDCVVVLHIHVLTSTTSLIRRMISLGFRSEAIILIPKPYSTIQSASSALSELGRIKIIHPLEKRFKLGRYDDLLVDLLEYAAIKAQALCRTRRAKRCILVDDGGFLSQVWNRVSEFQSNNCDAISIPQTASGLYRRRRTCVRQINVATSAAKRHFESKIIIRGVMTKLNELRLIGTRTDVAVIGLGALGHRLAERLVQDGHHVYTFDINPSKFLNSTNNQLSWFDAVRKSQVVFGCTGKNFMHFNNDWLFELRGDRHLLSLTSRDVEFKYLLEQASDNIEEQFGTVNICERGKFCYFIHNSGFPINFDRQKEWETPLDISLTRGLLLIAILQALCVSPFESTNGVEKLALFAQRKLVTEWLKKKAQKSSDFGVNPDKFEDIRWWLQSSGGSVHKCQGI